MPSSVCSICGTPISAAEAVRAGPKLCNECRAEDPDRVLSPDERARRDRKAELLRLASEFPQWTTMPPGSYESLGIVAGTSVISANLLPDIEFVVLGAFSTGPDDYRSDLDEARQLALGAMCEQAQERAAEMVVGIRFDTETAAKLFLVTATGTAVRRTG